MRNLISFVALAIVLTLSATLAFGQSPETNPTCADFGYTASIKLDPPNGSGSFTTPFGNLDYYIADGKSLSWSTLGAIGPFVSAVIVKGGNGATVKHYDPRVMADSNITAPANGGGSIPEISHVSWCYKADLVIVPVIVTSAPVTLSGRVLNKYNRAVSSARVSVVGADGVGRYAYTNTFGYYKITGIPVSDFYIAGVTARGYTFDTQTVNLSDNVSGFNFTAK